MFIGVHLSAAPKPALVPANRYTYMQLDHIAIHIPSLIRNERGLVWQPGPRTSNISTFL